VPAILPPGAENPSPGSKRRSQTAPSSSKQIVNLDANVERAIRYVQSTGNRSVDHGFSLREFPHMSSGSRQSVDRDLPEFTLSPGSRRIQRCLPGPPPHSDHSDHPPCGQFIPEQVAVNTPFEGYAHGARLAPRVRGPEPNTSHIVLDQASPRSGLKAGAADNETLGIRPSSYAPARLRMS
jgi:hypothetical protein